MRDRQVGESWAKRISWGFTEFHLEVENAAKSRREYQLKDNFHLMGNTMGDMQNKIPCWKKAAVNDIHAKGTSWDCTRVTLLMRADELILNTMNTIALRVPFVCDQKKYAKKVFFARHKKREMSQGRGERATVVVVILSASMSLFPRPLSPIHSPMIPLSSVDDDVEMSKIKEKKKKWNFLNFVSVPSPF